MSKLVIISAANFEFLATHTTALRSVELATLVAPREDVTWLTRQLKPAAVLVDVGCDPSSDDPIFELARISAATGTAVVAVRPRFEEVEPCSAPRMSFVADADGIDHVVQVVQAMVKTQDELPEFDIEIDVDLTWQLPSEKFERA